MAITNRPDTYANIHRGLRVALFNLSTLIGRTDFLVDHEIGAMRAAAQDVLHFLHEHAVNEERWVLPALEAVVPGASDHDHESHARIDAEIAAFEQALDALLLLPPTPDRCDAGESLYHQYNRFLSGYLLHMEEEELATTAMLYAHLSDDELRAITANILRNSSPEDLAMGLRAFLPAIDRRKRQVFLREALDGAPPAKSEWLLGVAADVLPENELEPLRSLTESVAL